MPSTPVPRGMLALGWSGTLPFLAPLVLTALQPALRQMALAAFVAYGAVILSFLGGTRWGRGFGADAGPWRFAESVLPSLVALSALLLVHRSIVALLVLAAGFSLWLVIDLCDPLWPAAYRRMRLGITLAVLSMHAAWALVP